MTRSRRRKLQSISEAAIGILPAPEEVAQKHLDELITDMALRASAAAETAWAKAVASGQMGSLPLPTDLNRKEYARRIFLTAYGMALLDHTMEAVKRMKAAADIDQQKELSRLVV